MLAEISAGLSSLKAASDIIKGLNAANTQAAINEVKISLQESIFAAREALASAQDQQATSLQRIRDLEQEIVHLKDWEREKQRYELKGIAGGVVGYMLKPTERGSEPPHWLCATCYGKNKKAFLQDTGAHFQRSSIFMCGECQAKVATDGDPRWL